MKLLIEIPKEFEEHFNNDRFIDILKRIHNIQLYAYPFPGRDERELIEMLEKAFLKAEIIKE